eukprot:3275397-Pyramimonas_sp.AAC.1
MLEYQAWRWRGRSAKTAQRMELALHNGAARCQAFAGRPSRCRVEVCPDRQLTDDLLLFVLQCLGGPVGCTLGDVR